jgi:hypothetical protein
MQNIKPTSPVMLGLCTQDALDDALAKAGRVGRRQAGAPGRPAEAPEQIAPATDEI